MKKMIKITLIAFCMAIAPLFLQAQNPPHPNTGNNPGSGNTPVGGGAPIDGGISILLALGLGYGIKKVARFKAE
ncbi:MAG: hypothetical protein KQI35_14055 [Bacteroidetes bacterium]|nr:hypothetical protein [Bacteroidota bacterium]